MKSSSELFPVELVSAEHRGTYFEDLYSVKHNRSQDRSVEVAVLHLHAAKDNSGSDAFLFVHDVFDSHWQWMDDGANQQVISALLNEGYSIWLFDWRGHGSSKHNRDVHSNTLSEMAATDLPAVVEFIQEKSRGGQLSVVSAGYGAQMVLRAMPQIDAVSKFVLVDAQCIKPARRYWIPFVRLKNRTRLLGRQWVSNRAGEHEPASLFIELLKEAAWFSRYRRKQLKPLIAELQSRSHRIFWLCTSARFERKAHRLLGTKARTHRVNAQAALSSADVSRFVNPVLNDLKQQLGSES